MISLIGLCLILAEETICATAVQWLYTWVFLTFFDRGGAKMSPLKSSPSPKEVKLHSKKINYRKESSVIILLKSYSILWNA